MNQNYMNGKYKEQNADGKMGSVLYFVPVHTYHLCVAQFSAFDSGSERNW